eukprot:TRINITY_DN41642_c0_g1_i1.p1 TRINITY_DN41642_c0_g1~~TRINITY_DN41642_c0_g1_i1.p1  ORF type:complete len:200 (+),score=49.11 TRINITY_DN41642_c0_g1_i1:23-601(+)
MEEEKRGVVYLSTIPEGFNRKADILRYFESFGDITNCYLVKHPHKQPISKKLRRKQSMDGEKVRTIEFYTEGWIEYRRKKDARRAAELLNGQPVDSLPRYQHRHILWNLKYLKGFRWVQLEDKITSKQQLRRLWRKEEEKSRREEIEDYRQRVMLHQEHEEKEMEEHRPAKRRRMQKQSAPRREAASSWADG